ncbi:unnamed protein product [Paramecium primaurelia]|uniref:Uncharacterized protein n=1 Tax=Paramecium primaurelia TaxID=5886 RepID=A0A8S1M5S6_PARPR|nr:unnamed protein product [Paramecium primaurelia]
MVKYLSFGIVELYFTQCYVEKHHFIEDRKKKDLDKLIQRYLISMLGYRERFEKKQIIWLKRRLFMILLKEFQLKKLQ